MATRVCKHALHLARQLNKLYPSIMKKQFCTDPTAAREAYHMKRGVPGPFITPDFEFEHPMFGDAYGIRGVPIGKDGLPVWVDWSLVNGVLGELLVHNKRICYLCAGITAIGSVNFLKTGRFMVPSMQQFIDCSTLKDPLNSGNELDLLEYTIESGGLLTESFYPFTGVKGLCKCNQANMGPRITIDDWRYVLPDCEKSLKHAIAHQPLIAAVHLGNRILVDGEEMASGMYQDGVISGGPTDGMVNHAMVAMGYGEPKQGTQAWRAQNSHGPGWGQLGRCWIAKGTGQVGGAMGILRYPLVPLKWAIKVLKDLKYAETHEWVKVEGDLATVGITDHAQDHLGDVVYVELPEVGASVTQGSNFGAVISVKATSDINSPVSGEVVAVNEELHEKPALVNGSPYEGGWIIKVKVSDAGELNSLMDDKKYSKFCEEEDSKH